MTDESPKQQPDIDIQLNIQDALDAANSQVGAAMAEIAKQAAIIKAMERKVREQADVIVVQLERIKALEPKPPENPAPLAAVPATPEAPKPNQKQEKKTA